MYDWYLIKRLALHPGKSEAMLISKTRTTGPLAPIQMGTDTIEWVNKSRLLGTTVDDKLTWAPHMLDLKKGIARKLDLIKRFRFLPQEVLINFTLKLYCLQ